MRNTFTADVTMAFSSYEDISLMLEPSSQSQAGLILPSVLPRPRQLLGLDYFSAPVQKWAHSVYGGYAILEQAIALDWLDDSVMLRVEGPSNAMALLADLWASSSPLKMRVSWCDQLARTQGQLLRVQGSKAEGSILPWPSG